ncbi:hypothetical protein CYY_001198 [Polysphondylium violaceum]|uniref:Fucosyltransferase n=1 Tax=Polysphondylium violaceum TaxID=133409 RepID=A0A8J4Q3M5_9MYCE|nr:hypothetical protein CYY_001198 [Polysphondylium violaceum]
MINIHCQKSSTVTAITKSQQLLFVFIVLSSIYIVHVQAVGILIWSGGTWCGYGSRTYTTPNYVGQNIIKPKCSVDCEYMTDKAYASAADAILFEAQPFAGFGYEFLKNQPNFPQKQVNQLYINFGYEHEVYFPVLAQERFHENMDVNNTFRKTDHVRITFACSWGSYDNGSIEEFRNPPVAPENKIQAIGFMSSNCNGGGAIYRTCYTKDLMNHIQVDALGSCMHNKDLDEEDKPHPLFSDLGDSLRIKRKVLSKYMFSLAFENNNMTDYVTEKVYTSLLSGSVPIYMGAPNIDDWVPKGSVIKTSDFKNPKHLADHLNYLLNNHTAYNEYFNWKKEPYPSGFVEKYNQCVFYSGDCRLCEHVSKTIKKMKSTQQAGHRSQFGEPIDTMVQKRALLLSKSSCLSVSQNSSIPKITDQMTIMFWINPTSSFSNDAKIITNNKKQFEIYISPIWKRSYIKFCIHQDNCFTGEKPIKNDEWKHVAVTVSPNPLIPNTEVVSLYLNGVLDISFITNSISSIDSSHDIKIGCQSQFVGQVDDFSIWNIALDQTSISRSMFKKYRGDEHGLNAYMTFNHHDSILDYSKHRSLVSSKDCKTIEIEDKKLDLNCC